MKVFLSANNLNQDGYLSLPFYPQIAQNFSMDQKVSNNEAEEILAEDILEFVEYKNIDRVLDNIVIKLRHGGLLTLSCLDLDYVLSDCSSYDLSLEEVNSRLFGGTRGHKSILNMPTLISKLEIRGLKIIHKRRDGFKAVVTAKRPEV